MLLYTQFTKSKSSKLEQMLRDIRLLSFRYGYRSYLWLNIAQYYDQFIFSIYSTKRARVPIHRQDLKFNV